MGYINIKRAILHILDTNINEPVLSEKEMFMDMEQNEFLERHIEKLIDDPNFKKCETADENDETKILIQGLNSENFIENSQKIGLKFFDIMYSNPAIPPADLLICTYECENKGYIGILKFNYKTSYIHSFHMSDELKTTSILKQKTTIANEKQKIDECILIESENFKLQIKEKKYEVNGEMVNYLSEVFIDGVTDFSLKEKYNIIEKTTEKIVKEYYNDDVQKKSEIKNAIKESVEQTGKINIEQVADKVFKNNDSMKQNYISQIKDEGFEEKEVEVTEAIERKIAKKQKIKTDEGIEISIPSEILTDKSKIEFKMNDDGTMSIIIKAINSYTGK